MVVCFVREQKRDSHAGAINKGHDTTRLVYFFQPVTSPLLTSPGVATGSLSSSPLSGNLTALGSATPSATALPVHPTLLSAGIKKTIARQLQQQL